MFLVGLTGGVASGKSTVAQRLVERGARLVDADQVAREVLLPGTETYRRVVAHFGDAVVGSDGFIDRTALGSIVFGDADRLAALNELTHPPILAAIADRLEAMAHDDGVVVLDVPLLVEAGVDRDYDAIVVVATRPATQEHRLVTDRGLSREEARRRIAAQAPLADKLAIATHVIWNEGTVSELLARTDDVADALLRLAAQKARRR